MTRAGRLLRAALPAAALLCAAPPAGAVRVVAQNLEQMTRAADRIVVGVCTARAAGEQVIGQHRVGTAEFTFEVREVLKGSAGATLTLRQVDLSRVAGVAGAGGTPLRHNPLPLPEYAPGQEVLLFLGPTSAYGLASPVALDQAVFDVTGAGPARRVAPRRGRGLLFRGMSRGALAAERGASPRELGLLDARGPLPYDDFVSLVRKLAR